LAGISSGIEPVYQLYYKRRRKLEKGNPKITFIDQNGDGWEEYVVYHPKYQEWIKTYLDGKFTDELIYGESVINAADNPYYKATSYEIDPIQRVKLQATIQKWIDHSISSTINLPETVTEEEVSNIYMQAWKQGCKGITIYRNNCRTGVLVDVKEKKETKFEQKHAPKRPKILEGELKMITIKGIEYLVAVGLLEGKPYEVMAGQNGWSIPKGLHYCQIIKEKGGIYSINVPDVILIDNIITDMTDEQEAVTRLVSTSLRHGADVKFIVEQLNKTKGDLTSFNKAIARSLKRFIKDGEISTKKCDKCGSSIVFEGGCEICKNCGESKCG
jgi:ribonucleoside-diphosphate reductase alpha chain